MWDPSQVIAELLSHHAGEKALVVFRAEENREELKKRGFYRIWRDGEAVDLDFLSLDDSPLSSDPSFDIVLDRLVIRDGPRLSDSIEMAWREGHGKIQVIIVGEKGFETLMYSSGNMCDTCDIEIPAPYPLLFSFNHPVGACPECKGFGNILTYDEDLIIPDKHLSLVQGAVDPWTPGTRTRESCGHLRLRTA